jgi:hypothetical protein
MFVVTYCCFVLDDLAFWPATADSEGINAWVAIDDMPANRGGGFALSVGSHVASWRHKAHGMTLFKCLYYYCSILW